MSLQAALIDLAPDMPAEDAVELLGVTFEQLAAELEYRAKQKHAQCLRDIAVSQKASGQRKFLRGDGGGEVEMMIHPTSYHYWGQRLGYECWDDPQFRREYRRDVEASRIKTVNDRLTIVKPDLAPNKPASRRGPVGKRGRWAA
jgi:hypothetical protein